MTQAAGGVGGWAGSVLQHSQWRRAPLSRMIATVVTWIGGIAGKVPRDVRQHLQFGPFRQFLSVQHGRRTDSRGLLGTVSRSLPNRSPDLDKQMARDFEHVAKDEDRHFKVFEILANALTEDDTLAEQATLESLTESIREVGEEFLPRDQRRISDIETPIGSGCNVHVVTGRQLDEKATCFRSLLDNSDLVETIRRRADFLQKPVQQLTVAIKPTFMLGYHHKDPSPITDPETHRSSCQRF